MNENKFDYENYIQAQLKKIDNLDERRFAREVLLEGLGKVFAWTEAQYDALEQRVLKELDMPSEKFSVCMTVVEKRDYDPIDSFWFPVCQEDLKEPESRTGIKIYLKVSDEELQRFWQQKTIKGRLEEDGREILFQIGRPAEYREAMKKLYSLFVTNHIPWRTVHMGHLDRFFELKAEEEIPKDGKVSFEQEGWNNLIRQDLVPLWNLQKISISSQQYRMPCLDAVFYEYIFFLPEEREEEDGYLLEAGEDILSIRYEADRVLLKTAQPSLSEVWAYRVHQGEPSHAARGYSNPILSNRRGDHLAARYLHRTGNFLQTPVELYRKIREMSGSYEIDAADYEITHKSRLKTIDGKVIFADMNEFSGVQVFSDDGRSVLLIRLQAKAEQRDYLYESQVRYILSQLQMEFMEYRCVGVLL